jgi:hypothetical protein
MNVDALRHLIIDQIRTSGMLKQAVADRAGISREMLYKFTAGHSDLGVTPTLRLLEALGLRVSVVRDFEPLPADHRQRKTRQQRAFLASAEPGTAFGIGRGAHIGTVHVPDLGDDG